VGPHWEVRLNADNYLSSAVRIVFTDRTWWWRALAVAAIGTVPYVGPLIVFGYFMVLMRDVAWGVDRGMPHFAGGMEIMRRAWDGFVVSLVWALVLVVPVIGFIAVWVTITLSRAGESGASPSALPWWFLLSFSLLSAALNVPVNVALLRTSVYLKPSAGLSIRGVLDLIRRYPAGFWRVTTIMLGVFAVSSILGAPVVYSRYFVTLNPVAGIVLLYGGGFIASLATAPLRFVMYAAYGLWARDTDPASWPPLAVSSREVDSADSHVGTTAQAAALPLNDGSMR